MSPRPKTAPEQKLFDGEMNPDPAGMRIVKRKRFCQIMREGKRMCRLEPEEREAVVRVCEMIERRTKEMEK